MAILGMILFWLVMLVSVAGIPFGLPGTFLIPAAALVHSLLSEFSVFSWTFIAWLVGIAVFLEIIEAALGAVAAKTFGGSKWGMIGAGLGGFVGAVMGTPVAPVTGTLLGCFIGAFLGAMLLEGLHSQDWHNAWRVGIGAFLGALGGKLTKIVVAIGMVVAVGFKLF